MKGRAQLEIATAYWRAVVPDTIIWAVQQGSESGTTRPAQLLRALQAGGHLRAAHVYTHGGTVGHGPAAEPDGVSRFKSPFAARRLVRDRTCALLTPSALLTGLDECLWIDAYDDWSIAPDVSKVRRGLARAAYFQLSRGKRPRVLTVNSPYMAARLGTRHMVPNGVDAAVASIPPTGDDRLRVLIMGSLHRGRLCRRTTSSLESLTKDVQVVVAGPGTTELRQSLLHSDAEVVSFDYLSATELATFVGPHTVALLPLRVSDYTLSQDPMKVYVYLALGVPVVMPRMLWPRHLPMDRAVLFDYGDSLCSLIAKAAQLPVVSDSERQAFAEANSWDTRATAVSEILASIEEP